MDQDGWRAHASDVNLFTALTEIGTIAASMASGIDDTRLAVGSESMREATLVYK